MYEKPKTSGYQVSGAVEFAGIGARFVALFIDGIIQFVVALVALLLIGLVWGDFGEFLLEILALAFSIGYNWFFWTRRDGQTPGKAALGIQVVKVDGSPINDVDAVIRAVGYQVSSIVFGLGYIWAIFDGNNQSWHDKLARTYVVRKDATRHAVQV